MTGLDPTLIWSAALVVALAVAMQSAKRHALEPRTMYWAGVAALAGGLWGSHILGTLVHGAADPLAWFRVWDGGKSYFGGLFAGAVSAAWLLRRRGASPARYGEAAVPAVALGYAIARVGCFVNGDDYGTLSSLPWAVRYPAGTEAHAAQVARGWIDPSDALSLPVHPVQLYAAIFGFALFLLLRGTQRGRLPLFAALYATGRFSLEYLRGDFLPVWGPLSLPQCWCLLLLAVSVWLTLRARPRVLMEAAA